MALLFAAPVMQSIPFDGLTECFPAAPPATLHQLLMTEPLLFTPCVSPRTPPALIGSPACRWLMWVPHLTSVKFPKHALGMLAPQTEITYPSSTLMWITQQLWFGQLASSDKGNVPLLANTYALPIALEIVISNRHQHLNTFSKGTLKYTFTSCLFG